MLLIRWTLAGLVAFWKITPNSFKWREVQATINDGENERTQSHTPLAAAATAKGPNSGQVNAFVSSPTVNGQPEMV